MIIYLFIFVLLTLCSFLEVIGEKINVYLLLTLAVIFLLLTTAVREGIGTDFYNYKEIFNEITNQQIYNTELGFVALNYLANFFGGFKILLLLTATINLLSILFVLRKLKLNASVGVLTYYSLFYLNHNFNTIRHGLMAALVWLAFYFYLNRSIIKSFIVFLFAVLFHQLGIILLPFQFLTKIRINFIFSILLLCLLYLAGNVMQNAFLMFNLFFSSSTLDYYQNDFYAEGIVRYQFGFGFFLYLIIYFLILRFSSFFRNVSTILFLNRILFLGLCVILLFASVSIFVERIANVLLISIVFIFASLGHIKSDSVFKFFFFVVIILIDFFYLFKVIHLPGIDRMYQFIPYKFSF